jgi:transcriptional regulator with XRE-family HTH domain
MAAHGLKQDDLAQALGVTQTIISRIITGKMPGRKHLEKLATVLQVPYAWLLRGDDPPDWARRAMAREETVDYDIGQGIAILGTAAAGTSSQAAVWSSMDETAMHFPNDWVAVSVTGNSAYPVAYPGQFVLIDMQRCISPRNWDLSSIRDLADNICLIVTNEGETQSAYIKRLCVDDRAPDGFFFASIDSGRGSPYLPSTIIDMIVPVVGVVFEDPRIPRMKGRNRATVII